MTRSASGAKTMGRNHPLAAVLMIGAALWLAAACPCATPPSGADERGCCADSVLLQAAVPPCCAHADGAAAAQVPAVPAAPSVPFVVALPLAAADSPAIVVCTVTGPPPLAAGPPPPLVLRV